MVTSASWDFLPPSRGRGGFTSTEVLFVLVLLGILGALAVPRLQVSGHLTRGAAQRVGTTLLAAQRAAVTRQHAVVVALDTAGRALRIHYDRDNDGAIDTGEHVRPEPLGDGVAFGRGGAPAHPVGTGAVTFVKRQGALPAVTFHRNGSASEEGGIYLTSRQAARAGGRAADARLVVIERATGRTSWFSYGGTRWEREF